MDMSFLNFLRQFRSTRKDWGGALELPGVGVLCWGRSVSFRSGGLFRIRGFLYPERVSMRPQVVSR